MFTSSTRHHRYLSVTLTASSSTTPEIEITDSAWGSVFIPGGSSITTLTYYAAPYVGGTHIPAQDSTPAAITQTVEAGKAYPLPYDLFGAGAIRIVANTTGIVGISLKS